MKPAQNTMTQIDNLPGEEIPFTIGDPRWVMKTQSDLYSNRELAVTREYSTNAFDANKQKALDEGTDIPPIEVTLPSTLNPYFKVRDFGYGMTRDILAEVYTKFGTSTKRDSNHYNGMLGYGCKSAVAYATQFTVVSIADGIKSVAVITRKPDWSIVMKIVSQSHSDEPSGTEVTVPVHNHAEFRQKAMDFYKFWLPGTVKVDGKEVEQHVGDKIAEGFYASAEWNTSYVVMGNVPYRIENANALFWNTKMNAISFVAYVDTGDVEFTPSREDLMYTDLTKVTLRKVIADFSKEIVDKAQGEINNAASHSEAFKAWRKWTALLGDDLFGDLTFKGDKLESDFKVDAYRYSTSGSRGTSYNVRDYGVEMAEKTLFVTGFNPGQQVNSGHKQKVRDYLRMTQKWNSIGYVLFVRADDIDSVWLPKDNFVEWETLKAAIPKPVRTAAAIARAKRAKGSFDIETKTGRLNEQEPDEDDDNTYYMSIADHKRYTSLRGSMKNLPGAPDVKVVLVGANRMAKFKRDFPKMEEYIKFAKSQIVKDGGSLLTQDAKDLRAMAYYEREWFRRLDPKKVDDPEIVRYIGLVTRGTKDGEAEYDRNVTLARYLHEYHGVKEYNPNDKAVLFKEYPLLESVSRYNRIHAHVYLYMNAVYAARKDKND